MKKLFVVLLPVLFLFSACDPYNFDTSDTFPEVNYKYMIKENTYEFSSGADALRVISLFHNEFGCGEFSVTGTGTHYESAVLLGKYHSESVQCNIVKVKVYKDAGNDRSHVNEFNVDLINDKNETLSYCYMWQGNYDNVWRNEKSSTWCHKDSWYKNSTPENRTSWNIVINR